MTLRTELEKLVRLHGYDNIMCHLGDIITNDIRSNESELELTVDALEDALQEKAYWEYTHNATVDALDDANGRADAAEAELEDIRSNFSTLIKTVYEEEGKLNDL